MPNFKHAKEVYLEIEYGDEIYKFDPKAAQSRLEKKIVRAMSLYRIFLDPKDKDKIEIVFKTSAE